MSLFYNPQESGKGVSKTQSQLKPFYKFWELLGRKFWYLIQLNCLYVLLCIPVITIGPATVALMQVMRKFVLEQPIFVFSEFFRTFKKSFNFRAVLTGIFSLVLFVAFASQMFMSAGAVLLGVKNSEAYFNLAMVTASGVVFLTMNVYIYLQMACLNLKMPAMLKNAGILCIAGIKRNAVSVLGYIITLIVLGLVLLEWNYLIVLLPLLPLAQLVFLSVFNAYPVIQKYIIDPYYEERGEKNPEIPDYSGGSKGKKGEKGAENSALFTDLGGQETPVDKKKVKSTGKLIK